MLFVYSYSTNVLICVVSVVYAWSRTPGTRRTVLGSPVPHQPVLPLRTLLPRLYTVASQINIQSMFSGKSELQL